MDLKFNWLEDVQASLNSMNIAVVNITHPFLNLLAIDKSCLILNLIPLINNLDPTGLVGDQTTFKQQGKHLLHLWEDVWLNRKFQVLSRICALLGLNERIHGRKTNVALLTQKETDSFLNQYHIQGSAKARYRFCLLYRNEVVACASFSGTRLMKDKGENYRSVELIRFATAGGLTIVGGLSKLIKHFSKLIHPDDVMSYADRDWSLGKGYDSSGFTLDSISEPSIIWLCTESLTRYFQHRLPADHKNHHLIEIFNTGNLKYIRYL